MKPFLASLMVNYGSVTPPDPEYPTTPFLPATVLDGSYSWWCNPISLRHIGYNYYSYVDISGAQMLARIDNNGNKISVVVHSGYPTDEHNTPGFIIIDNKIVVAYCGHNTPAINRVIYDLDLNIVNEDIVVAPSGNYSYSQFIYSNGKLFLFSRTGKGSWSWFVSNNNGVSFGSRTVFISRGSAYPGSNLYMSTQLVGENEILVVVSLHPVTTGNANILRKLSINTVTGGIWDSDDILINNIYSGFTLMYVDNLREVYQAPPGYGVRLLDTTSDGTYSYILIATFIVAEDVSNYVSGDYKMLRLDNAGNVTEFNITTHGKDTFISYFGGAYFVQNIDAGWEGDIYLGKEDSSVWTIEKWNFNGSSVSKTETIDTLASATLSLTRPKPPYNSGDGGARLIYQKGNYYEGYTNWDNELKLI